jgi:HD superfamily phosphohydrolase
MNEKTSKTAKVDTRARLLPNLIEALPDEYEILNGDGDIAASDETAVLGRGGSSVVLRALYRQRLRRALKIVIPRDEFRTTQDAASLVNSYENEVIRLAELNHENIAKITDFGIVTSGDGVSYPFIATEFIDGVDLLQFARATGTTGEQILAILNQVLSALSYIHLHQVMHCDLKPANILVRSQSDGYQETPSAVIVDLGSSKYFSPMPKQFDEQELVYLFSTPEYVMLDLQLVLGNKTQNRITRKDLRRYFPHQDLFSFGVIIQNLLDDSDIAGKLREAIGPQDYESLIFLRDRLRNPKRGKYSDSQSVLEAFGRLSAKGLAPLGIPELSPIPGRGIVIPNITGRSATSERAQSVISHPLFQRMNRLPQLDLLSYVLPGATNTRFAHTIHTYELARSAITYLLADWRFRIDVCSEDVEAILFSTLLNALGHYHFLHMFEDFIEERKSEPLVQKAGLLRDDELLDQVMGKANMTAGAALAPVRDIQGRTLAEITSESLGLDWADVRRRQRYPSGPLEGMLAALLSCPVDVDKLAYLIDDSVASGLPFGRAIAPSPIFEALSLPTQEDWERNSRPNPIMLGVTEKAISYLESSVLTRYWNIQTGYWNRTNRSLQAMVKYQIAALVRAGAFDFTRFLEETVHLSSDGALRWLTKQFLDARAADVIDPQAVNPVEDLLLSRRLIYKRLLTISGKSRIPNREPDHKIFERLRAKSPLGDDQVCDLVAEVLEEVAANLVIRPGEVLLDLPRARREEAGGRVLVYTDDRREQLGELFTISPFLEQHRESFELHVKRLRVFLHPRVYNYLEAEGVLGVAYDECLHRLRAEYAA